MALLSMNEVGKLVRVTHKEHRCVVADQIPVALRGIALERKAAYVAFGIRGAELTGYGRKACNERRAASGLQHLCLRIPRDVGGDRQRTVCTPTLGMHRSLGNALAVLVSELLQQLVVLQQQRTPRPGTEGILVIGNGIAGASGQLFAGRRRVVDRSVHGALRWPVKYTLRSATVTRAVAGAARATRPCAVLQQPNASCAAR